MLVDNIPSSTVNNAASGNIVINTSDHFPQFLIMNDRKIDFKTMNYYIDDYRKLDKNAFNNDFSDINWDDFYSSDMNCDEKFDMFLKKTSDFISAKVSLPQSFKGELKLQAKPWITNEHLKIIKYRDKLCKQFLGNQDNNSRKL